MEFECVGVFVFDDVFGLEDDLKGFKNGYGVVFIIICFGSCQDIGEEEVDGILVGIDNNCLVSFVRNGGNDVVLVLWVFEVFCCYIFFSVGFFDCFLNFFKQLFV